MDHEWTSRAQLPKIGDEKTNPTAETRGSVNIGTEMQQQGSFCTTEEMLDASTTLGPSGRFLWLKKGALSKDGGLINIPVFVWFSLESEVSIGWELEREQAH